MNAKATAAIVGALSLFFATITYLLWDDLVPIITFAAMAVISISLLGGVVIFCVWTYLVVIKISRWMGIELRLSFRTRKIDGWNELKRIGLAVGLGFIGFLIIGIILNGWLGFHIPLHYFTGTIVSIVILTAFWRHLTGGPMVATGKPIKTHRRQFASALPWHIKEGIDEKGILRWYDRRDKPADEFMFYGDMLPTVVPESMMYRFCRLALHRQSIVLDVEAMTLKRTGRKLRAQEILSKQYFTRQLSPRFLPEQYEAIKIVLELTGFWIDSRAGHPGYLLISPGTSPQKITHRVRWGWIDIIIKMDKQKKPFWQ